MVMVAVSLHSSRSEVYNFTDCAAAGYPVMESYPRQCRTPSGQSFTEDIGNALEKASLITVASPQPNQRVVSPLVITGQAVGGWFFEASFPVELKDADGLLAASTIAQTSSDWMTTAMVPFSSTLTFTLPTTPTGTLVLKKDNPSGDSQYDDQLTIPVVF
ncbi:hypothetical protein A2V68_02905 [candidate division Kazan bacterium RBG_13_50_9]|uniref:Bacterial spore germination immunoglobulin-like domain-containing protein n=1 Tax=candidate division Kazan bacterium RBG_13_50_9 TaxID=1798535 RepID=A0A1F4NSR4_UNCK3|nr:MAG: hypothetical protein A2V68_02905 [candidate division Kazan bacterium RBG_13_50_9]